MSLEPLEYWKSSYKDFAIHIQAMPACTFTTPTVETSWSKQDYSILQTN